MYSDVNTYVNVNYSIGGFYSFKTKISFINFVLALWTQGIFVISSVTKVQNNDKLADTQCNFIKYKKSSTRKSRNQTIMYLCDWSVSSSWIIGNFYGDDPLWDRARCRGTDTCCTFNTPPSQLSSSTNDALELRSCGDQEANTDENVRIWLVEIYVQYIYKLQVGNVKTLGLLQPKYFGCLSCMPVVWQYRVAL